MPTINKELQGLSLEDIEKVSTRFLMGWHDPKYDGYSFRIKGLNHRREEYGLPVLTKQASNEYRIAYVKSHFSDEDIESQILNFCLNNKLDEMRWIGIELFDCRFGREYAKLFKELIGSSKWRKISEGARVNKLVTTQTAKYGGVGVGGKATYDKMLKTKIDKNRRLKKFESIGEEVVYDLLVEKFGKCDVVYQYGVHPYDKRYPFPCDFYIKSLDLFIEVNTHFSHSNHWFDANNSDDLLKVKNWQSLGSKYGKQIRQWTENDITKRNTAKKNKLNYLVFWDGKHRRNKNKKYNYNYMPVLEDFKKWYYEYDCNVKMFLKDNPNNTY